MLGMHENEQSEIGESIKMIAQYVRKQIDDVKKASATRADIRDEVSKLKNEVMPAIYRLEDAAKSQKTDDIERRLDRIETHVADLMQMKAGQGELDRKLTDLQSFIAEKGLQSTMEDKSLVGAHIKRINELDRKIDNINSIMSRGGEGVILTKYKEDVKNQMENFKAEVASRLRFIDQKLNETAEKMSENSGKAHPDDSLLSAFAKQNEVMAEKLKEESDVMIAKLREETGSYLTGVKDEANAAVARLRDDTGAYLMALREEIEAMKSQTPDKDPGADYDEIYETTSDLRKTVEEDAALRASDEKKMSDLVSEVRAVSESLKKLKNLEEVDIKKVVAAYQKSKNAEDEFEKKMKSQTMKIVTNQLDEFAKALDRKVPQLATKDELVKLEGKLEKQLRIGSPEAIDVKMAILEKRLNELLRAVRGYTGSFVIE